jgi:hypothetical protein
MIAALFCALLVLQSAPSAGDDPGKTPPRPAEQAKGAGARLAVVEMGAAAARFEPQARRLASMRGAARYYVDDADPSALVRIERDGLPERYVHAGIAEVDDLLRYPVYSSPGGAPFSAQYLPTVEHNKNVRALLPRFFEALLGAGIVQFSGNGDPTFRPFDSAPAPADGEYRAVAVLAEQGDGRATAREYRLLVRAGDAAESWNPYNGEDPPDGSPLRSARWNPRRPA